METVKIGYCKGCGRSVFGPASHPLRGFFEPREARCGACLAVSPFRFSEMLLGLGSKDPEHYTLACRQMQALGKTVLVFFLRRSSDAPIVGHLVKE